MHIAILTTDLFLTSQLIGMIERLGHASIVVGDADKAVARLTTGESDWLLVDLDSAGIDCLQIIDALSDESRARVIAYGPHVHAAKLKAARDAGCEHVVTRGQIVAALPELLTD